MTSAPRRELGDPPAAGSAHGGEEAWLEAFLTRPVQGDDLAALLAIRPPELSPHAQLVYVAALDRVEAFLAGLRVRALVAFAGAEPSGAYLSEVALEHEVAVARRSSRHAAGRDIETARALTSTFPAFADALAAGEVSQAHCRVLVERTRPVTQVAALEAIAARVLPKARRLPVARFAAEVARAIAALDHDAAGRHRRARHDRCVYSRPLEDGMGFLGVVDEWTTIMAIQAGVDADALALRAQRRAARDAAGPSSGADARAAATPGDLDPPGRPDGSLLRDDADVHLGPCRAEALAARVLGRPNPDGSTSWDPREATTVDVELVIDLDTLRGEADRLALLDGQPVPASIAREHAAIARTWRRVVTDPIGGHLLDYGARTYLPEPLRRFVMARDASCRAPDCSVHSARRLQLDHAVPFPDGDSSAANTGALCTTCHQLKTARHTDIVASATDGSATWTTAVGQRVHLPARPYLDDPPERSIGTDHLPAPPARRPPGRPPDDDPPPF